MVRMIAFANKIASRQPTEFSTWARMNLPVHASAQSVLCTRRQLTGHLQRTSERRRNQRDAGQEAAMSFDTRRSASDILRSAWPSKLVATFGGTYSKVLRNWLVQ